MARTTEAPPPHAGDTGAELRRLLLLGPGGEAAPYQPYQRDQPSTAWVHAIARYKLIDLLRSKSVREALHDPLDDDA